MNIKEELFNIINKYNITASELSDENLNVSQISRMKNNKMNVKQKHYPYFIHSINRVLKDRGFNKKISFDSSFFNSIENKASLEEFINDAIIKKEIFKEEKIKEILKLGEKYEIHSYKFRFLLATHYKNIGEDEKALVLFREIFNNFDNNIFRSAILINWAILSKEEETEFFYRRHKELIDKQNDKIKIFIYYQLSLKYIKLGFYMKAKELLLKILSYGILNNTYFKAHTQLGNCYSNLDEPKLSNHHFLMGINDIMSEKEMIKGLTNTLVNYSKLNDLNKLDDTLDKILSIKKDFKDKIYRIDYQIAKAYSYKKDQKNAQLFLEREVFYKNDFDHEEFDPSAFYHSIKSLIFIYGDNVEKQNELIKVFKDYPCKFLDYKKIMYLLRFYRQYNLIETLLLFIDTLPVKFQGPSRTDNRVCTFNKV